MYITHVRYRNRTHTHTHKIGVGQDVEKKVCSLCADLKKYCEPPTPCFSQCAIKRVLVWLEPNRRATAPSEDEEDDDEDEDEEDEDEEE